MTIKGSKNYLEKNSLIFLCFLIFSSCTTNRLLELENDINSFIDEHKSEPQITLRLDTISSFEWDELLIAGPYTDLKEIEEYNLNKYSNSIKSHDRFTFFGFIKDKKGIKWIELNGTKIYEDLLKGGKKGYNTYSRKDCVFQLTK